MFIFCLGVLVPCLALNALALGVHGLTLAHFCHHCIVGQAPLTIGTAFRAFPFAVHLMSLYFAMSLF